MATSIEQIHSIPEFQEGVQTDLPSDSGFQYSPPDIDDIFIPNLSPHPDIDDSYPDVCW